MRCLSKGGEGGREEQTEIGKEKRSKSFIGGAPSILEEKGKNLLLLIDLWRERERSSKIFFFFRSFSLRERKRKAKNAELWDFLVGKKKKERKLFLQP